MIDSCRFFSEAELVLSEQPLTLSFMQIQNRITLKPGRRSGKPCIRETRITVYDVLSYLASGMTESEILEDFPSLEREDILACYAYAAERDRKTFHPNAA